MHTHVLFCIFSAVGYIDPFTSLVVLVKGLELVSTFFFLYLEAEELVTGLPRPVLIFI